MEPQVPPQPLDAVAPDTLIAYHIHEQPAMRIVPAPTSRGWMNETNQRFANRCLPLLLANQAGWVLLNTHRLRVTWNGGNRNEDLRLEYRSGGPPYPAASHFGHGILTWHIPYLFRTPPGYNLLVRGPTNWPKDGIAPLDGLVETDWAVATFTMNWQLTRPYHPVDFEVDEPICMVMPQRRGDMENFQPHILPLATDPDLQAHYTRWAAGRAEFNASLLANQTEAVRQGWQKDYFQGHAPDGPQAPEHQTKLKLHPFSEDNT